MTVITNSPTQPPTQAGTNQGSTAPSSVCPRSGDARNCLCGKCDDAQCSPDTCNTLTAPFCGSDSCIYEKGSAPPALLVLAFVDSDSKADPAFDCIQVQMNQNCKQDFQLDANDNGGFTIKKGDECIGNGNGNSNKLNPNIHLLSYGNWNEGEGSCNVTHDFSNNCASGNQNSCVGTEVHTVSLISSLVVCYIHLDLDLSSMLTCPQNLVTLFSTVLL